MGRSFWKAHVIHALNCCSTYSFVHALSQPHDKLGESKKNRSLIIIWSRILNMSWLSFNLNSFSFSVHKWISCIFTLSIWCLWHDSDSPDLPPACKQHHAHAKYPEINTTRTRVQTLRAGGVMKKDPVFTSELLTQTVRFGESEWICACVI